MSRALSVDLRVRVLAAVARVLTNRQAGERFGVSAASVSRWRRLERGQGATRPGPLGGDRRSHGLQRHGVTIVDCVAANRDITLSELGTALEAEGGNTSIAGLWRFLDRHKITLIAPWVLDGPINRDAFETYVAKVPIPELRPGDVVVMDKLSSHEGPRVRETIEAAGAGLRHLPPYSLISTRSRWLPRSLEAPSCARPLSEPSAASGTPSAAS